MTPTTTPTRQVNSWRTTLAERIAPLYADIADVRAVILTGNVARGRDDDYSDLDIAVFWRRPPSHTERNQKIAQISDLLKIPIHTGELREITVFDRSDTGLLWEDVIYLAGDAHSGFKVDINHRTVAAMDRIMDDVLLRYDMHGHKLEVMYSIQRVRVLYGEDMVSIWQRQASQYPDGLAHKVLDYHLGQLRFDIAMHLHRNDLYMAYCALTEAQFHLMGSLFALNRVYRPEYKRLLELCEELPIKPENLYTRLNASLLEIKQTHDFDALLLELFDLITQHETDFEVAAYRETTRIRRQPFDTSPLKMA